MPHYQNIVFCVSCGSTNVDRIHLYAVQCNSCHQVMAWNAVQFGIARNSEIFDAQKAFETAQRFQNLEIGTNWMQAINSHLQQFLNIAAQILPIFKQTNIGIVSVLSKKEQSMVIEAWQLCQQQIENAIQEMQRQSSQEP